MTDDHAWVSAATRRPDDYQPVYARGKAGAPQKVVFHAAPWPRWVGLDIVYQFQHFEEWAPRVAKNAP